MTATRTSTPPALGVGLIRRSGREKSRRARGRFLVIVGPDGIGKTTVARALADSFPGPTAYFHFTPPVLHALAGRPPDEPTPVVRHAEPAGSRVLGLLRLGRSFARAWLGHAWRVLPALGDGALVIADRWLYGYVADPLPLRFFGPRRLGVLAMRLLPTPDLVAVLWSDAPLVYERKQEMSVEEIERGLEAWAGLPVPRKQLFDASEPPEVVAGRILEVLGS